MDMTSPAARPVQNAKPRPTEGPQNSGASTQEKAAETRRSRGRPKGSKNKVKAIMTNEFLLKLKGELTPNDYAYLENVVRNGGNIDVLREMQIMFAILGRNLMPVMIEEMQGDPETGERYFRKDVTERLKVWQGVGNALYQIEKNNDEGTNPREKPIVTIFERSGLDLGRLKILVGVESGDMGGNVGGTGRREITVGAVPDQLPERSFDIQDSEQGEAVGIVNDDFVGDSPRSMHEEELRG